MKGRGASTFERRDGSAPLVFLPGFVADLAEAVRLSLCQVLKDNRVAESMFEIEWRERFGLEPSGINW